VRPEDVATSHKDVIAVMVGLTHELGESALSTGAIIDRLREFEHPVTVKTDPTTIRWTLEGLQKHGLATCCDGDGEIYWMLTWEGRRVDLGSRNPYVVL